MDGPGDEGDRWAGPATEPPEVVVREATLDDVPGLEAMYERLSDADRRLRFFSLFHPPRQFFVDMVHAGTRGGCTLVAEARAPDGTRRIVGDAWFAAPHGGEGELAITVDRGWRGGLGARLLDALTEAAAARGVGDLLAVVMPENRAMLHLAHARPNVTVDDGDRSTVCLAVSAADRTPLWPERRPGRRRVLVESPSGRWSAAEAATRAGLDVRVCSGPPGGRAERCPARRGERCPLVADADVVVMVPRREIEEQRDLLDAHAALHPEVPMVVQVPRSEAGDVIWTSQVVPASIPVDDLVHLVGELAAGRDLPRPPDLPDLPDQATAGPTPQAGER